MTFPPLLMQPLALAPIVALVLGSAAVQVIRRAAPLIGFVDNPDRRRKLHEAPIALGGGIAVWLATWTGWLAGAVAAPTGSAGTEVAGFFSPLALTSFMMLVLGALDDRYGMRGCHKLGGQILVAAVMVASGLRIDSFAGLGLTIEFGSFAGLATLCWIVLVVNAFNLIDGMDGFCGGVSFVIAATLALMAYSMGRTADALIELALAGALASFLRDNRPPARIYLGDAGSMTLGLMFSALSIRACTAEAGGPVSLPPLLSLLSLPLLDVAMALGRRWLAGHSLFMPDRGHIHHRLRVRLGGAAAAMGAAVILAGFGAGGAVLAWIWGFGDGMAIVAIVTPVVILIGTDTFGGSEMRLIAFRLRRASTRLLAGDASRSRPIHHECRIHGGRDWAEVWDALIRSVEVGEVRRIELAIDMPAAGEAYHGLWSLPGAPEAIQSWSVIHAIQVRGVHAGELRVSGGVAEPRARYLDRVEDLVRILEDYLHADDPQRQVLGGRGLSTPGRGRVVLSGAALQVGDLKPV